MRRVRVDETPVVLRDAVSMLSWCLLTEGLYAVAWMSWLVRDVRAVNAAAPTPRTRDVVVGWLAGASALLASAAGLLVLLEHAGRPQFGLSGRPLLELAVLLLVPLLVTVGATAVALQRHAAIATGRPHAGVVLAAAAVPLAALQLLQLPVWAFVLRALQGAAWSGAEPDTSGIDDLGALAPAGAPATERAHLADERDRRHRGLLALDELEAAPDTAAPRRPPIVVGLLGASWVVVYLVELFGYGRSPSVLELAHLGGVSRLTATGAGWWHVLAANFLHGSPEHIAGNLLALLVVGIPLERAIGARHTLLVAAVGALATSAGTLVAAPDTISVGGSGIVYAIFGAAIGRDLRGRTYLARSTALVVAIGLLATFTTSGISVGGHVGGLIAGLLLGAGLAIADPLPADAARQRLRAALRRGDRAALATTSFAPTACRAMVSATPDSNGYAPQVVHALDAVPAPGAHHAVPAPRLPDTILLDAHAGIPAAESARAALPYAVHPGLFVDAPLPTGLPAGQADLRRTNTFG